MSLRSIRLAAFDRISGFGKWRYSDLVGRLISWDGALQRRLMSDTLTLAHLSDVHLAPIVGFQPKYWNVKRGLGYLNWRRNRQAVHRRNVADAIASDAVAQRLDHIAVTGDLANLGLPGEYDTAFHWLSALGSVEAVSVVPGNHDIYTRRLHGASCLTRWGSFMTSDAWGQEIGAPAIGFPFVRRRGPVALIGLNSGVFTPPFVASGRLGEDQLAALGHLLDAISQHGLARVVLIHHPPLPGQAGRFRGLSDAAAFERVLAAHGAELVLHGHNHEDMLAWRDWPNGRVPIVGVASASAAKVHKDEPLGRYNLLHISRAGTGFDITCVTRGLEDIRGPVVELRRQLLVPEGAG